MSINGKITQIDKLAMMQVSPKDFLPRIGANIQLSSPQYIEAEHKGQNFRFNYVKAKKDNELKWLAFSGGVTIGDNISFLMKVEGMSYSETVSMLMGDQSLFKPYKEKATKQETHSLNDKLSNYRKPLSYPAVLIKDELLDKFGMDESLMTHLMGKGIMRSVSTRQYLKEHELSLHQGVKEDDKGAKYALRHGILFAGNNEYGVESFGHFIALDKKDKMRKDLYGSDKTHVPIIHHNGNQDKATLYISEGPKDMVAAMMIHQHQYGFYPNATFLSGAGILKSIETNAMKSVMDKSSRVVILRQHEKNAKTEKEAGELWDRFAQKMSEVYGVECEQRFPNKRFKDFSDQIRGVERKVDLSR